MVHWDLVIVRNVLVGVVVGSLGAICGADSKVDVAVGGVVVADVGKERLIIGFPRGYGCVFSFILAVIVPVDDGAGDGWSSSSLLLVAPKESVAAVYQPKASVSAALWLGLSSKGGGG